MKATATLIIHIVNNKCFLSDSGGSQSAVQRLLGSESPIMLLKLNHKARETGL